MKKTNEKGNLLHLFRTKKFVEENYDNDKNLIIEKYNELGYRDAAIVSDSVVRYNEKTVDVYLTIDEGDKYYIRNIDWVGNTVYPSDYLSAVLNMKPGDVYNQKMLNKRTMEDEDAVANLYMDRGYLFFQLVPIEGNVQNDSIDLEIRLFEGPQARINKVLEYIHAEHTCRTRILLNYFGEKTDKDCGTCDICVAKHESGIHNAEYKAIRKAIEELVKDKAMPVIQLSESLPFPQDKVLTVIRFLADHDEHFRLKDNQLAGV